MGKSDIDVGLLTSENYWDWSLRMEALLVDKDLEDCISRDGRALPQDEQRRDKKALMLIRAHVSPNLMSVVATQQTAKGAWDALKTMHDTGLAARRAVLEKQLSTLKKEKSEDIVEYCTRADRIRLQLHTEASPVTEERLKLAILQGLPKEYTYIRNTLTVMANMNLQEMTAHLRVAEQQLAADADEEAVALKAAFKRDLSKIKCYNCHKYGHYKKNCPHLRKAVRGRGRNGKGNPDDEVALTVLSGNQEEALHAGCMHDRQKGVVRWVIDTGATQHILSDASMATVVRKSDVRVKLANGKSVMAAGVCNLEMVTQVGRRTVKMTLTDVLVIPEAPYNLLSGRAAMRNGISVDGRAERRVIKSSCGSAGALWALRRQRRDSTFCEHIGWRRVLALKPMWASREATR